MFCVLMIKYCKSIFEASWLQEWVIVKKNKFNEFLTSKDLKKNKKPEMGKNTDYRGRETEHSSENRTAWFKHYIKETKFLLLNK